MSPFTHGLEELNAYIKTEADPQTEGKPAVTSGEKEAGEGSRGGDGEAQTAVRRTGSDTDAARSGKDSRCSGVYKSRESLISTNYISI